MSLHKLKSMEVARRKGGYAGMLESADLWDMSKRELVEIAIRLGASAAGECDNPQAGIDMVSSERIFLIRSGII